MCDGGKHRTLIWFKCDERFYSKNDADVQLFYKSISQCKDKRELGKILSVQTIKQTLVDT